MITDLNSSNSDTHHYADICIVGSGPAGITLALQLIDKGVKVIVLESGNLNFDQDTQNLYSGEIRDNLPAVPLTASRLRFFGGTSNHWGGQCAPFDRIDFDKRPWLPNSGWPISRSDLEPFYPKANELIGLGPYNYEPDFWAREGQRGFKLSGTSLKNSVIHLNAMRFGIQYKSNLESAKNVMVILNANLTRIHVNDEFNKVTSLEVRSLKGSVISLSPRTTILACGGVENARLLLNSNFDSRLGNIGRYYSFHPRLQTAALVLDEPLSRGNSAYDWREIDGAVVRNMLTLSKEAQEQAHIPNHAAWLQFISTPDVPSYSALKRLRDRSTGDHSLDGVIDDVWTFLSDIGGAQRQWSFRHGETPQYEFSLVTYMDQIPNPESRVILGDDKDALGLRRPIAKWQCFDSEIETIWKFNDLIALSVGAAGIGRMEIDGALRNKKHFQELIRVGSGAGHQIGTTRMSETSADGVVDRNCRVHGIENLFCAGSSVFPTTSWINPTMTIVALSLRLADHLNNG